MIGKILLYSRSLTNLPITVDLIDRDLDLYDGPQESRKVFFSEKVPHDRLDGSIIIMRYEANVQDALFRPLNVDAAGRVDVHYVMELVGMINYMMVIIICAEESDAVRIRIQSEMLGLRCLELEV